VVGGGGGGGGSSGGGEGLGGRGGEGRGGEGEEGGEEVRGGTVNDTNLARVAEFKGMKFEIRGYSTFAGNKGKDKALSEICANVVLNFLTTQGTPAWRLRAKGLGSKRSATGITQSLRHKLAVEFSRTK